MLFHSVKMMDDFRMVPMLLKYYANPTPVHHFHPIQPDTHMFVLHLHNPTTVSASSHGSVPHTEQLLFT